MELIYKALYHECLEIELELQGIPISEIFVSFRMFRGPGK